MDTGTSSLPLERQFLHAARLTILLPGETHRAPLNLPCHRTFNRLWIFGDSSVDSAVTSRIAQSI